MHTELFLMFSVITVMFFVSVITIFFYQKLLSKDKNSYMFPYYLF